MFSSLKCLKCKVRLSRLLVLLRQLRFESRNIHIEMDYEKKGQSHLSEAEAQTLFSRHLTGVGLQICINAMRS